MLDQASLSLTLCVGIWTLAAGCTPGIESAKTDTESSESTPTTDTTDTTLDSLCDLTVDGVVLFDDTDVDFAPDHVSLVRHEYYDADATTPVQYDASVTRLGTGFGGSLLIHWGSGEPRAGVVYEDVVATGTSVGRPSISRLYLSDGDSLEVLSGWVLYPTVGLEPDDPHAVCFGLQLEDGHTLSGVAAGPLEVQEHWPVPPGP